MQSIPQTSPRQGRPLRQPKDALVSGPFAYVHLGCPHCGYTLRLYYTRETTDRNINIFEADFDRLPDTLDCQHCGKRYRKPANPFTRESEGR